MTVRSVIYQTGRDITIFAAEELREFTVFTAKWLGYVVSNLASQNPVEDTQLNLGAVAYTGAFAYYAYKGGEQMLTPWHDRSKWLVVDNRFKKSVTTVIKPVKISDLLKASAPKELNDLAIKNANEKLAKAEAEFAAAQANVERLKALPVIEEEKHLEQKHQDSPEVIRVTQAAHNKKAIEEAEATVKAKAQEFSTAKAEVEKLKTNLNKDLDISQKEPKSSNDKAPIDKSKDQKPDVKVEAKPDEDAFILTATLDRKDKPSKDETHFPIPFTNESVIFKQKVFFDSCTKGSVGAVKFTIGALGALDNLDYVFLSDGYIQSRHVKNITYLGPWLSSLASVIGGAGRTAGQIASLIIESATYYDSRTYGLNNLVGTSAFAAGSYYLYKKTDFTWFKIKTKPGENNIQYKTISSDAMKLFGSVVCGSLSLLALDNMLSGKGP